jgi:SAM-dependent methyltransferase
MASGKNLKFMPVLVTKGTILFRVKQAYKRAGAKHLFRAAISYLNESCFISLPAHFWAWYYNKYKSSETFEFQGNTYHYFFHHYCTTWKNERTVIIPIIWDIVKKSQEENKRILEVGNVLSYIYKVYYDVVDKYEIAEGVINEDIVEFNPSKQYDLIVSLVTLQSVGWNETPSDNVKFLRAIENLKRLLAQNGQLIIVHGIGYNIQMDRYIEKNTEFHKKYYLKHISGYRWKEANWEDIKDLKYDYSVPTATGVAICVIRKNDSITEGAVA